MGHTIFWQEDRSQVCSFYLDLFTERSTDRHRSRDRTVRQWDAQTGTAGLLYKGHTAQIMNIAYSADGQQIVSDSEDGTVQVWDGMFFLRP